MTDTKSYSYATHLDIKFPSLDLIDVEALAKSVTDQWYNQTLCRVNDSVVRLGVMQGEYHWHKHDNDDEFFFVLSGRFIVDLEARSVDLLPGQGFVQLRWREDFGHGVGQLGIGKNVPACHSSSERGRYAKHDAADACLAQGIAA